MRATSRVNSNGNRAVFLDRDGTINVDKGFVYKIEDFEFLPGAVEGLKLLSNAGYLLIIITNQSGIARGYYTEEDFHLLNAWMLAELKQHYGIKIDAVYYCPHLPPSTDRETVPTKLKQYRIVCNCRKPGLELFYRAVKDFNIDLSQSFAIGDKERDCSICDKHTGCRGFLLRGDKSSVVKSQVATVKEAMKNEESRDYPIVSNLLEAARLIILVGGSK